MQAGRPAGRQDRQGGFAGKQAVEVRCQVQRQNERTGHLSGIPMSHAPWKLFRVALFGLATRRVSIQRRTCELMGGGFGSLSTRESLCVSERGGPKERGWKRRRSHSFPKPLERLA